MCTKLRYKVQKKYRLYIYILTFTAAAATTTTMASVKTQKKIHEVQDFTKCKKIKLGCHSIYHIISKNELFIDQIHHLELISNTCS